MLTCSALPSPASAAAQIGHGGASFTVDGATCGTTHSPLDWVKRAPARGDGAPCSLYSCSTPATRLGSPCMLTCSALPSPASAAAQIGHGGASSTVDGATCGTTHSPLDWVKRAGCSVRLFAWGALLLDLSHDHSQFWRLSLSSQQRLRTTE